ncbi:F-box/FBD/LRR-repeat protein At1g13570-like isoform X1 [Salvia miltiorrhiza]|uniref:F-box/FBD/LRR-repeat protein At1g13570-like isoform X1 n=2 Tax=Salvia miltiorrhiza TaxID=226208 RepID=UPI0025AC573B|nr:F-box/FBD/LRR-repeat protein At1g13570-like isoform X1 [Salvia miltiorrhiza]
MSCSFFIRMKSCLRTDADLLTNLPNNIIENILGCLPLRDVVRTSILSREWRYKWASCPDIVFDFWFDQMFLGGHKLESLIYQILKLHKGPLLKFGLQVPDLKSNPDIDQWVRLLPNNTLQELTLHVSRGEAHRLSSHLLTFQHLKNLRLYNCVFDPVPGFKGFSKLVNLELQSVVLVPESFTTFIASCPAVERLRLIHCTSFDCLELTGPKLKYFEFNGVFKSVSFKNCPALKDIKLTFSSMEFKRGNSFSLDLVRSLSCLPALEDLQLQAYALEDLVEHDAPNRLPISLNTLKNLHLSDMYFEKIQESSCAICFIRSCPNLQRLKITAFTFDVVDAVADFLRSQTSSESLAHLKTVKMQLFSGIEAEMEFVKYLLASATALEEMAITPHAGSIADGGESILNELKQYPRASPGAEIFSSENNHGNKHV